MDRFRASVPWSNANLYGGGRKKTRVLHEGVQLIDVLPAIRAHGSAAAVAAEMAGLFIAPDWYCLMKLVSEARSAFSWSAFCFIWFWCCVHWRYPSVPAYPPAAS